MSKEEIHFILAEAWESYLQDSSKQKLTFFQDLVQDNTLLQISVHWS